MRRIIIKKTEKTNGSVFNVFCLLLFTLLVSIMAVKPVLVFAGNELTKNDLSKYEVASNDKSVEFGISLYGQKYGKYTYYIDKSNGSDLVRTKDGVKISVVAKNVGNFLVGSGKVFYRKLNRNTLYSVDIDGKNNKKIASGVTRIIKIKDGFVYYGNNYGALCRIDANGENKKKLVDRKYDSTYVIYKDRVYYTECTLVDHKTGTETSIVYSKKIDGTDKRIELPERAGWGKVVIKTGAVTAMYDNVWYIRNRNGKWKAVENDIVIPTLDEGAYFLQTDNGYVFWYVDGYSLPDDAFDEDGNLSPEFVERSNRQVIYSFDKNANMTPWLDLTSHGIKLAEYISMSVSGGYYCIDSMYDQSYDGLYIFDFEGEYVKKIDFRWLGEEGYYRYKIKNDRLYLEVMDARWKKHYYIITL